MLRIIFNAIKTWYKIGIPTSRGSTKYDVVREVWVSFKDYLFRIRRPLNVEETEAVGKEIEAYPTVAAFLTAAVLTSLNLKR